MLCPFQGQRKISITLQLDLPETLVKEARAKGLLDSASMGELIATELRRRNAAAKLNTVLDQVRAQPGEPLSEEDIATTIKTARRDRRARESGR